MKKLIYFLSITMFLLQGCSSDSENNSSNILIKTIKYKNSNYRTEYSYNGNKISEINRYVNDVLSYKQVYNYTGDLITQIKSYDENNESFGDHQTTFIYNNSKEMISEINIFENGNGWRRNYINNPNGTVTENGYTDDKNTQNTFIRATIYTFSNNMLLSAEYIGGLSETGDGNQIDSFTYDDKNSPFKNIVGYNIINKFNPLAQKHNVFEIRSRKFSYNYNSDGYPTEKLEGSNITEEYIYY
jgi:hypothetical protein